MNKDSKEVKSVETDVVIPVVDEEINYDLIETGPLFVDPRHKKPGFEYHFISDEAGEIEKRLRRGFHIVEDTLNIGNKHASNTSKFGSAVTVSSKCGRTLVLMAISSENFAKFMAYQEKKNRERTAALGKIEGVPDHLQHFNGESLGGMKITRKS